MEGSVRGVIEEKLSDDPCMKAVIKVCEDKTVRSAEAKALLRTAQDLFGEYARTSQRVSQDTVGGDRGQCENYRKQCFQRL